MTKTVLLIGFGEAGQTAALKLLRSIVIKGVVSLLVECPSSEFLAPKVA